MRIIPALLALCFVGVANARPAIIVKETARVVLNTSVIDGYEINGPIASDGDDAIIIGSREEIVEEYDVYTHFAAFLFHRSGANWVYVRTLGEGTYTSLDDYNPAPAVAMQDGLAGSTVTFPYLFERQANGEWLPANIAPDSEGGDNPASDIEIDQGRVIIGWGSWGGTAFERDSAGLWHGKTLYAENSGNGDNGTGGPVTLSGPWAAVSEPYNFNLPAPAISMFNNSGPRLWTGTQRLLPLEGHTFGDVVLRGQEMFIEDNPQFGLAQYVLSSNAQWVPRAQLRTPGDFMSASQSPYGAQLKKGDNFILHRAWDYDRRATVLRIFQRPSSLSNEYAHVATLVDSRGGNLSAATVHGRRVIAVAGRALLIYDLPATFAGKELRQETFETGNGGNWTQLAGSQWSVAQSGDSRVFRQASTVGDAGASFDPANWASQSIQADIKPTAFNGADRWVGLATRRSDAANYYYVTLRSSGVVALKRNRNGAFANIASASFPVALNRTYRVRLESFGATHRVYIDGVPVLEAVDTALIAGHPALLTYRAAADFDNVMVSPSWTTTVYAADEGPAFDPPQDGAQPTPWAYSGTGQWYWEYEGANNIFRQTSTTGDARAAIDPGINQVVDQIVEARVRVKSFGTGSGEKWVGLMANYTEPENFLYMSLRSSNVVTLRRVEGNRIRQIGTVVMPVALDRWYQLRLDAVGDRVRAYVDGKLMIEAVETQPRAGNGGVVTYRAAADFDDFREIQP